MLNLGSHRFKNRLFTSTTVAAERENVGSPKSLQTRKADGDTECSLHQVLVKVSGWKILTEFKNLGDGRRNYSLNPF